MEVTVHIPDDLAALLSASGSDLSRRTPMEDFERDLADLKSLGF